MKIISAVLILITAYFSVKHGWGILTIKPEEPNMFTAWNFGRPVQIMLGVLTLAVSVLVLFPSTYFAGNLINAMIILLILAFQVKDGNMKEAMIEIPFLLLPLVMIYLGHPLKK